MSEEFGTSAAVALRLKDGETRRIKKQIESDIGAVEMGVSSGAAPSAQATPDGGQLTGRRRRRERRTFRLAIQRTDDLETAVALLDDIEEKVGGNGGGGALGGIFGALGDGAGGLFGGAALTGAASALSGAATALTGAAVALGGSEVADLAEDLLGDEKVPIENVDDDGLPVNVPEDGLPVDVPEDGIGIDSPDDGIPVDTPDDGVPIDEPEPIPVDEPGGDDGIPVDDPSPLAVDDPSPLSVATGEPLEVETVEPIEVDAPDSIPLLRPTETDSETETGREPDIEEAMEKERPRGFAEGIEQFRDERILPAADEFQDSLRIGFGLQNPGPGDGGENIGTPIRGPLDAVGRLGERLGTAGGELGDSFNELITSGGMARGSPRGPVEIPGTGVGVREVFDDSPAPSSGGTSTTINNEITATTDFDVSVEIAADSIRSDLDELQREINRRIDDVEQSLRDEIERVERDIRR